MPFTHRRLAPGMRGPGCVPGGSPMVADDGGSAPAASLEPRLGIYVDGPYTLVESETGTRLVPDPADSPFLLFALEVGRHFESVALFARVEPESVSARGAPHCRMSYVSSGCRPTEVSRTSAPSRVQRGRPRAPSGLGWRRWTSCGSSGRILSACCSFSWQACVASASCSECARTRSPTPAPARLLAADGCSSSPPTASTSCTDS